MLAMSYINYHIHTIVIFLVYIFIVVVLFLIIAPLPS
jgi:hypothetical protein